MNSKLKVGVIGDFNPDFRPHVATNEALGHAAAVLSLSVEVSWLATETLAGKTCESELKQYDALWCAPGSPYKSLRGALNAIRFAREQNVPLIGTCGGYQHIVIEYARHVLGFEDAEHAEYDPYASRLFISALTCSLAGKTLPIELDPSSRAAHIYGREEIEEEYYCNFGLNPEFQEIIDRGGLKVVGKDRDGEARVLELPQHRFFIATLYVPQARSKVDSPHPLIVAYLEAAAAYHEYWQQQVMSAV